MWCERACVNDHECAKRANGAELTREPSSRRFTTSLKLRSTFGFSRSTGASDTALQRQQATTQIPSIQFLQGSPNSGFSTVRCEYRFNGGGEIPSSDSAQGLDQLRVEGRLVVVEDLNGPNCCFG